MKVIRLTQGQVTVVDDEDFEALNRHKWYALRNRYTWYALRRSGNKRIRMHREILKINREIDHKNGNGLDNRRENLRECTPSQNSTNRKKRVDNTNGFKGVYRTCRSHKWLARIGVNSVRTHLGSFDTKEEAATAYNEAAKKLHGEFARLNEVKN